MGMSLSCITKNRFACSESQLLIPRFCLLSDQKKCQRLTDYTRLIIGEEICNTCECWIQANKIMCGCILMQELLGVLAFINKTKPCRIFSQAENCIFTKESGKERRTKNIRSNFHEIWSKISFLYPVTLVW